MSDRSLSVRADCQLERWRSLSFFFLYSFYLLGFANLDTIPFLSVRLGLLLNPISYFLQVWIVALGLEEVVLYSLGNPARHTQDVFKNSFDLERQG